MKDLRMAGEKHSTITSYVSDINKLSLFEDFVRSKYLPYVQKNKRSWKTDERYLKRHILPYLGDFPLAQISEEKLREWLSALENNGLASSSRYRLFCLVKYILNLAVRWKVIPGNTGFRNVQCQCRPSLRTEMLSAEEKQRLLEFLKKHSANASARAIHLLLLTGASKSEILYARWSDVNFGQRTLVTRRTPSGEKHYIYLSDDAITLIKTFPRRAGVPWMFFRAKNGNRVVSLFSFWNKLRNALGRPTLRLNDLRHAFVYSLIQEGASYKEVRTRLGHYSVEVFQLQSELLEQRAGLIAGGFRA